MGETEINNLHSSLIISSHIITYGEAADEIITERIRDEIETMWNEAHGAITLEQKRYDVMFRITAQLHPTITDIEVYSNINPLNNYFRIEEYAIGNISFVDGLGCNSGYFKLENLYEGSTTAAHEYGHTLGLRHPEQLDYRGKGRPSIMYPRGTLVNAEYQYDPQQPPGATGGTMHPMFRKVSQIDIINLHLEKLFIKGSKFIIGEFSNVYHESHKDMF